MRHICMCTYSVQATQLPSTLTLQLPLLFVALNGSLRFVNVFIKLLELRCSHQLCHLKAFGKFFQSGLQRYVIE